MRKWRQILVSALLGAGVATATIVIAGDPAHATPAADCKTVTSTLTNRPDNGHGTGGSPQPGHWADVSGTRTVTICVVPPPVAAKVAVDGAHFHADVTDDGTLVTLGGNTLSPNNGVKLVAGVQGKWKGGFQADFEAPAPTAPGVWPNFDASTLQGKTFNGTEGPTTGAWVKSLWKQADLKVSEGGWTDKYRWDYFTCNEHWRDAYNNDDGQADGPHGAGDITGLSRFPCIGNPSFEDKCDGTTVVVLTNGAPSATSIAVYTVNGVKVSVAGGNPGKVTVTSTPIDGKVTVKFGPKVLKVHEYVKPDCSTPSPSAPAPTGSPTTPSLPVTGPNAAIYGGAAAALLAMGGALFFAARRRRVRFEA